MVPLAPPRICRRADPWGRVPRPPDHRHWL